MSIGSTWSVERLAIAAAAASLEIRANINDSPTRPSQHTVFQSDGNSPSLPHAKSIMQPPKRESQSSITTDDKSEVTLTHQTSAQDGTSLGPLERFSLVCRLIYLGRVTRRWVRQRAPQRDEDVKSTKDVCESLLDVAGK